MEVQMQLDENLDIINKNCSLFLCFSELVEGD